MPSHHQLAQFNIATALSDPDDPVMAGFTHRLDEINALADKSPGFVWRLQTASGHSTSIRVYDDDLILPNMSVWDSIESFRSFVYGATHGAMVRRGREWFRPRTRPQIVLWWIRAGTLPSVADGVARLDRLREVGPTPDAFTFARNWPMPERA